MDFITVKSIRGSIWSFRKDRVIMVSKRFSFTTEQLKSVPELKNMESCAIIRLEGEPSEFICKDSYESIMAQLTDKDE